jgi:hypothetical protein
MPATVNVPYHQELNLIVPHLATEINPTYPNYPIDSIVFNGVTAGLPPGLTVACNSQTAAPCTYLPAQLGCGVIQGTPTQMGTFNMTLTVTGYFTAFGTAVPYPISFTGYRIVVGEPAGINELAPIGLAGVRTVPNPFASRTFIEFQLARASDARVRVFNLLGDELWNQRVQGKAGLNRVPFEASQLQEGVYLYKVETGREAFTGRMMLSR